MSTPAYVEFGWGTSGPGNGESGAALTRAFICVITGLQNVKTVCDLGCGNGYMAGHLSALGYDVTGVDASKTGITIAQNNYSTAKFIRSPIDSGLEGIGLKDFDLVVSSDVVEHLYRPADLLEAAHAILRPNGQVIIGTPYHGYLKNLALSLTGKMDSHFTVLDEGGHIKFFSVKTLSELLKRHGFSDLRFTFYGRAPWLWKNMICLARKTG
jgi:2-polyprenyl-3-methyl-5-hydroxy-6-metoxy-1,4-benzoquinol methylase